MYFLHLIGTFNHANICKATSQWSDPNRVRDFSSLDEMNDTIIDNTNAVVKPDDILYFLGDFLFGPDKLTNVIKFRQRIVCKNLIFIKGNHDYQIWKKEILGQICIEYDKRIIRKLGGKLCFMDHFPCASWEEMGNGSIMIHAHSHGTYKAEGKIIDVGVDVQIPEINHKKYTPFHIDEIVSYMETKPIVKVDHH